MTYTLRGVSERLRLRWSRPKQNKYRLIFEKLRRMHPRAEYQVLG